MVGWGAFLLPLLVLIVGPTEFITNSIINAIGLTTQNFLQMSLFTDPLGDGSFTRNWTVFYWLWWISYTHGVAMFVTRVSRGRKIKEVIWGLIRQHRRLLVLLWRNGKLCHSSVYQWRNQRPTGAGNTGRRNSCTASSDVVASR